MTNQNQEVLTIPLMRDILRVVADNEWHEEDDIAFNIARSWRDVAETVTRLQRSGLVEFAVESKRSRPPIRITSAGQEALSEREKLVAEIRCQDDFEIAEEPGAACDTATTRFRFSLDARVYQNKEGHQDVRVTGDPEPDSETWHQVGTITIVLGPRIEEFAERIAATSEKQYELLRDFVSSIVHSTLAAKICDLCPDEE